MSESGETRLPQEEAHELPVKVYQQCFKDLKAAFHGDGNIPSFFAYIPVNDGITVGQVEHQNGIYTITREEHEAIKELKLIVELKPKAGDTSFEYERIALTNTITEEGKKDEFGHPQKVKLRKRRGLRYTKLGRKSLEELASEEEMGNLNHSQDTVVSSETILRDMDSLEQLQKFIKAIREGNLNIRK